MKPISIDDIFPNRSRLKLIVRGILIAILAGQASCGREADRERSVDISTMADPREAWGEVECDLGQVIARGQTVQHTFQLMNPWTSLDEPFRITAVTGDRLSALIDDKLPSAPALRHTLRLRFDNTCQPETRTGTVEIATDHPSQPELTVMILSLPETQGDSR